MNGSTFKRKYRSGRVVWGYSVDAGVDAEGRRQRIFKSGFKREKDADEAKRKVLVQLDAGQVAKPDPTVLKAFMADWFREYAERHCQPKTVERYRELAEYVLLRIGDVKLTDLSPLLLQRVFNEIKDRGGRNRKTKEPRPLAAKTVRNIAGVIHSALESAVEWELIKANPCTKKTAPKAVKREATSLDAGQLSLYADTARAHGIYELLTISSATGCRRGELLALSWADIDFVGRWFRIAKSLEQTKAGLRIKAPKNNLQRSVPLSASVMEILKTLRIAQEENRKFIGAGYRRDLDLVFCTPEGDYLKPDSISAKASMVAKKARLKRTSLHTLRHAHGSLLLSNGVPLPTVSKRLGHSSTYVTSTVYAHAIPKDEIAAAEIWETITQAEAEAEEKRKRLPS